MSDRFVRAAAAGVFAVGLVFGGAGCDGTPTAASPKEFTPRTKEAPGGAMGGKDRKAARGGTSPSGPE